ncbi:hypothetical protein FPSM_00224 [Flavobacterium psychrophilum]|nr:hypothetical protein FPSM_00224 [Flavobacterium psychrophilum]
MKYKIIFSALDPDPEANITTFFIYSVIYIAQKKE